MLPSPFSSIVYFLLFASYTFISSTSEAHTPWKIDRAPEIQRMAPAILKDLNGHYRVRAPIKAGKTKDYFNELNEQGVFSDLPDDDSHYALLRIWAIAKDLKSRNTLTAPIRKKLYLSLAYYCSIEAKDPASWPIGCFHSPLYFLGAWFTLEDDMTQDWQNTEELHPILETVWQQGNIVASHAWNNPKGGSRLTDPLSIDNFRNSAYYIVANFYPYRPLLAYALFMGSDDYLTIIVETAKRSIMEPVYPGDLSKGFWPEGINPDSTITAHGQQSFMYGYGKDYVRGLFRLISNLNGSNYAFEPAQLNKLSDVILDGMQWFVYNGQIDYSVMGRHNVYPKSGSSGDKLLLSMSNALLKVAQLELTRENELITLSDRLENEQGFSGSRYFWNVEDFVHRTEDFSIVINASSTRAAGPEITSNAQQNHHFGNGTNFIYVQGDEYINARGGMNYSTLPGITAEFQDARLPSITNWKGLHGRNTYSGGANLNHSGVIAFQSDLDLKSHFVKAKKAWFLHGDTMVALGADIQSNQPETQIKTTLNQTEWRSPVWLWKDDTTENTQIEDPAEYSLDSDQRSVVWQDQVAYVIEDGHASVSTQSRATDWSSLSVSNTAHTPTAEVDIFQISIDHQGSEQTTYAYAVYPSVTASEAAKLKDSVEWKILSNNPKLQAINFPASQWTGAAFYEAGKIENDQFSIQVNGPMVLLIQVLPNHTLEVVYQDPLRRENPPPAEMTIQFKDPESLVSNELISLSLEFPQGYNLGKPTKRTVKRASTQAEPLASAPRPLKVQ
ncbi:polysaccharide lyase family 8 super-sandwich domain-containing protein [Coraliomargarita sp. SDUM461004]|uniref:Polysaccharide lyase family 8 super-sandwich domain-containing protein n=1 Tax=Thalassobacterium sedimentorum TaxID=3041258 RepID=A0ABU1AGS2_9BACT|nr:polysaccharide lyase family 8 super-sandwich domain-containing protein [Coraliomargarita sp. SDUM461004]MDQ8192818.1 polysaccharide lyase family 8 super-sandwich domain-containing protein [Coraliomargarita sp. SDUM461004]